MFDAISGDITLQIIPLVVAGLLYTAPIWLPIASMSIFVKLWLEYRKRLHLSKQKSVLLEIRLPREITRTPLAMEIILTYLWQKGGMEIPDTFIEGKVRPWYSLELVSHEGQVKFYIWSLAKFKDLIESSIYANYPSIEIAEVEDYAVKIPFDKEKFAYWAAQFKLGLADAYPIRTYIDFGLDRAAEKEEHKIDPLVSVIEFLGSLKKGENGWIQILIRAHRKVNIKDGIFKEIPDWKKAAEAEIVKIREEATPETDSEYPGFPQPTKMQVEAITAIERSLSKFPYETYIRAMYIAEKSADKTSTRTGGFTGAFRAFSSNYKYFNEIRVDFSTGFDFPWQDFMEIRKTARQKTFLELYKLRSAFEGKHKFWHAKPFILTVEELATIYHFPGDVAQTPSLIRVPSKKSTAPSNLPI